MSHPCLVELASMSRKGPLLIVFLTVFIDLLGFGMVLPLLPIYANQFSVDQHGVTIGLLMSSFSAMQFLFAPLWGRLSDRIGRRPVLIIGLVGSAVFYALFGIATMNESLTWLFITRIGAGIAGATISTAQAYIADVTSKETRARGMALIGAAFGLGFTFGPLLGAAALAFSPSAHLSPAPGFVASGLSTLALLLAVARLPESLQPGSKSTHRSMIDVGALKDALAVPSVGLLLLTAFLSVLSFAGFETTLSLLLKKAFALDEKKILYFFAFIGLILTLAQGFLVRRLAKKLSEATMATAGAIVSILGFVLLAFASHSTGLTLMMVATAVEVTGFAFMTPSLNSLISRRSDPAKQGGILGVNQSMSSLARIAGPMVAIPLFYSDATLPYWFSAALMGLSLIMVGIAAKRGKDFASGEPSVAR